MKPVLKYKYFNTTEEFEKWQETHEVIIRNLFPDIMETCIGMVAVYIEASDEIPS